MINEWHQTSNKDWYIYVNNKHAIIIESVILPQLYYIRFKWHLDNSFSKMFKYRTFSFIQEAKDAVDKYLKLLVFL